jgi:3-oxoacyl-[acyl-carrier protein] reductase
MDKGENIMGLGDFSLEGKTAVVTGAASTRGIGRAIALALAGAGADVAICDINTEGQDYDLAGTAAEIRKLGRRSLAVKVDISDEKDVEDFIEKTVAEFGTVDIMVNNAAVGAVVSYQDVTRAQWEKLLYTNIVGCHNCCLAASRVMVAKKHGSIINISSTTGTGAAPTFYAYGVSKAGINQVTITLARELARHNVRVNAVAPGGIDTDISSHDIVNPVPASERYKHSAGMMKEQGPPSGMAGFSMGLGRIGKPEDIANTVLFLASEASSYITGQVLIVAGGMGG